MTFRVGQKVVCVDDSRTKKTGQRELVLHAVYTIRWVGSVGPEFGYGCYHGIRLVEVDRGVDEWNPSIIDLPFRSTRFRPVVERKTDISFAHEILRKVSRNNRVRA